MRITTALLNDFRRALRTSRIEKSSRGLYLNNAKAFMGGVFTARSPGVPIAVGHNTLTLEMLDAMLTAYLGQGAQPSGFYLAPFTNNTTPTSALTAATFAATQGEYTGYTQSARQVWTPNGASSGQAMSNSNAPGTFTIGASAVTITGAGLLTASAKSATTGTLVAAALFSASNALNPGSTLTLEYGLSATAA